MLIYATEGCDVHITTLLLKNGAVVNYSAREVL